MFSNLKCFPFHNNINCIPFYIFGDKFNLICWSYKRTFVLCRLSSLKLFILLLFCIHTVLSQWNAIKIFDFLIFTFWWSISLKTLQVQRDLNWNWKSNKLRKHLIFFFKFCQILKLLFCFVGINIVIMNITKKYQLMFLDKEKESCFFSLLYFLFVMRKMFVSNFLQRFRILFYNLENFFTSFFAMVPITKGCVS